MFICLLETMVKVSALSLFSNPLSWTPPCTVLTPPIVYVRTRGTKATRVTHFFTLPNASIRFPPLLPHFPPLFPPFPPL